MESILISAKIGYVSLTLLSWFSKFKFTGELKKKKSLLLFTPHFPKVLSLEPSCIWFFLVLSKLSLLVILLSWSFSITNGSYLCIPKLTCLLTSKIICPTTLYYNFVFFIKFKCICCWLKKSQPKIWELCFIQWDFVGHLAWETVSQETLRSLLWGGRGRSQVIKKFATEGR